MADKACEGIKILDLAWIGVGPISTKYLADHGATVVHIASHIYPDSLSAAPPFKGSDRPAIDHAWWSSNYNTSKHFISLNMNEPKAREIIWWFLTEWRADVISESFTPKAMRNWGLHYDDVKKVRPDIIYFSTCQFGQTGPWAMFGGGGNMAASMTGFYNITGWPDRGPAYPYGAYSDFINPRYGAFHILSALDRSRRTGKGLWIDQAQAEAAMQFQAPLLMDYMVNGRIQGREGNRYPTAAPHAAFRCKGEDRWVAIAVFTDEEWSSLCKVVGHLEWVTDPRFATLAARKANEDELERLIEDWTKDYIAEQVEAMMQAAGVAANAVESNQDAYEDPQLLHRNHFRLFNHPKMGLVHFDGPNFRLSKTPDTQRCPEYYGQSNEYVFKEIMGMTDDDIADLYAEGVLTTNYDYEKFVERRRREASASPS